MRAKDRGPQLTGLVKQAGKQAYKVARFKTSPSCHYLDHQGAKVGFSVSAAENQ